MPVVTVTMVRVLVLTDCSVIMERGVSWINLAWFWKIRLRILGETYHEGSQKPNFGHLNLSIYLYIYNYIHNYTHIYTIFWANGKTWRTMGTDRSNPSYVYFAPIWHTSSWQDPVHQAPATCKDKVAVGCHLHLAGIHHLDGLLWPW